MRPAKILLIHYTPPGVIGGVEHVLQRHSDLLRERGFVVEVMAGRGDGSGEMHTVPEIDAARPESRLIESELAMGAVSPRFHAARQTVLKRLEEVRCADYVIAHNAFTLHFSLPLTAALWQFASTRSPGSTIAWCHDLSWCNPMYIPAMHEGYPWDLLRTPAPGVRYVTVSAVRRQELLGIWPDESQPVESVHNGIDAEAFLRLSRPTMEIVRKYRLFDRDVVLLLPVRITRRKNIEAVIPVVQRLKERGLDVLLIITAPLAPHHPVLAGSYLGRLKLLREDCRVTSEVVFLADELGHNPEETTVSELYTVADALLMPSASEGFGLPIVEAGLARLPAIVSDIPVFQEVGGRDIWTFALDEAADRIAGQILQVLRQPASRLHRRVLREYRWDTIVDKQILPMLTPGEA